METQFYTQPSQGARLVILEEGNVRVAALEGRDEWKLGRYVPGMDGHGCVLLRSRIASREHGWFRCVDGMWFFVDNPANLNGTFCNGRKIARSKTGSKTPILLEEGDLLRIDNEDLSQPSAYGVVILFTTAPVTGTWTVLNLEKPETYIGRSQVCDICEDLPYISEFHACIRREAGGFTLEDCSSKAGTFLNGEMVEDPTPLNLKDHISICGRSYFFLGDRLLYAKENHQKAREILRGTMPGKRPVILTADIRSKKVKTASKVLFVPNEKELLRDIRLQIQEGTLVAVLGTAGAGKSTLMGCLSGLDCSGVTGRVIYRGVDLMQNLNQMRYLIGNVPQEQVIHPESTPEQELTEAARLRLSADTPRAEIRRRVEHTLELLSMTGVRNTPNSRLSGGEKTRVNVGIDLVADRDIYFLDEPERGLSPNLRDELYVFLRTLAHDHGKTIIAIIHDVSCIDMFDQVIFLVKDNHVGRLAFSGSPDEGSKFFGTPISKAYALLEEDPGTYVRKFEVYSQHRF